MNYQFHPDAFDEHYDSVAFYQNRLPGLGAVYIVEFDAVMAHICTAPNFYPTIASQPRKRGRRSQRNEGLLQRYW